MNPPQQEYYSQGRQPLPFEQALSSQLYAMNYEKSYLNKPLAKEDVNRIKELMKKPHMTKEELTEAYHHVSTNEVKFLNFGDVEKFQLTECVIFMDRLFEIACKTYDIYETATRNAATNPQSEFVAKLWKDNMNIAESNVRAILTAYLYMARGTLSFEGMGFMNVLTNRFEYVYPAGAPTQEHRSFFDRIPFIGGGNKS